MTKFDQREERTGGGQNEFQGCSRDGFISSLGRLDCGKASPDPRYRSAEMGNVI